MTDRLTDEQLSDLLAEADKRVPIASRIKHRKSGRIYHVMSLALREEDLEPLVIYRPESAGQLFARPLEEVRQRFTLVTVPGGYIKDWF